MGLPVKDDDRSGCTCIVECATIGLGKQWMMMTQATHRRQWLPNDNCQDR